MTNRHNIQTTQKNSLTFLDSRVSTRKGIFEQSVFLGRLLTDKLCIKKLQNYKFTKILTVVNIQVLSLTAPQHPRKAVMKTIAPIIIERIGASPNSDGNILVASLMLNFIKMPIITNAKPAN